MVSDFESSLAQARLLYLEILTAKKDRILGNDRSVQGQEFTGEERQFEEAVQSAEKQKWEQDKNEFWYDELGNYVFQLSSQCSTADKTSKAQPSLRKNEDLKKK